MDFRVAAARGHENMKRKQSRQRHFGEKFFVQPAWSPHAYNSADGRNKAKHPLDVTRQIQLCDHIETIFRERPPHGSESYVEGLRDQIRCRTVG